MHPRIQLVYGDITRCEADAIVNAANTSLLGGGGVDGAIHRAAGQELLKECESLNGCSTGQAKITKGYKLKAKHVIHTAGPRWRGGLHKEADLLKSCYENSLHLALKYGLKTVAFPNISTGIYGYPKHEAAKIAVNTITAFISDHTLPEKIIFVVFDEENLHLYEQLLKDLK
ncbi:MAG: O-acetyl-ADP-ribose deacetylase [Breznakibacter sp.]